MQDTRFPINGPLCCLLCLLLLLIQHILPPEASAAAPTTQSRESKSRVEKSKVSTPTPSTLTTEKLKLAILKLEALANQQIANNAVPGLSIAVVHDGKVVYAKGFGVRIAGATDQVDGDTVFQLASVSKSVASTVVAAVVSRGKATWDSRVCQLDPEFQLHDPYATREVTIRDLLSHRSGLPEHAGDLLEDIGYDRTQVLYRLRYQSQCSSFRSQYDYTNFGFTEGVIAAAKAIGTTWEDAADTYLFKPLSMLNTSARYSEFMARENKALNHVQEAGKWQHRQQRNPDAQSPAGGISSSANDMAKWMLLQLGGGEYDGKPVISKKELEETRHPQIFTQFSPDGLPTFYGLGFNVNYDQNGLLHLGHSGGFCTGAATCISLIPSERLGICVLTNAYPIGVAEGLVHTFTDVYQYDSPLQDWMQTFQTIFKNPAVLGPGSTFDYKSVPASPTQALKNLAYTGRFSNEFFGEIEVVEKEGRLLLHLGPKQMTLAMRHYNRDVFTIEADTENLTGTSGVRFIMGPDARALSVCIEGLDTRGQGTFVRI